MGRTMARSSLVVCVVLLACVVAMHAQGPQALVIQGVTSGCDIGNGDEWGIVHRDAVNHGKIRGSRVWVGVGHMGGVNPEELTGWETPLQTRQLPRNVEETKTVVTRLLDAGADMIM